VACGSAHADNVAPALYGGFTLVRGRKPVEVVRVKPPRWFAAVVHPHLELPTRKARRALPRRVELAEMTASVGNAAAAVAAIYKKDIGLFGPAIMAEAVVDRRGRRSLPVSPASDRRRCRPARPGRPSPGPVRRCSPWPEAALPRPKRPGRMAAAWRAMGIGSDIIISRLGAAGARVTVLK